MEITDKEFHKAIVVAVDSIMEVLIEEEVKQETQISFSLYGRSGSILFEENLLKPAIRKNIDEITVRIVKNLEKSNSLLNLICLDAEENESESDVRSFDDMSMIFSDANGKEYLYPINIKITNGNSADNIGGWSALDFAIFGNPDPNSSIAVMKKTATLKSTFMKKATQGKISTDFSDYFLLVFKKLKSFKDILESAKLFSLLTLEPSSFNVNMSQSLPIQFNSDAALKILIDEKYSIFQKRKNLLLMLLGEMSDRMEKELEVVKNAKKAVAQQ